MVSSAIFLNAGSSLRIMIAIGSMLSTSPTIAYSWGFFELVTSPASRLSSITKATARSVSRRRKESGWSFPYTPLKLTFFPFSWARVCGPGAPVLGGHRLVLDLEVGHLEFLLPRVHDLVADFDVVADRLLLVVKIGQRGRGFPDPHRDRSGFLHLLQGPRAFLG